MSTPSESLNDIEQNARVATMRDVIAPVFRYRRPAMAVALLVLVGTAAFVLLSPRKYEAAMTLLVKRERAETIVSSDPNASAQRQGEVTEGELNAEVELLKGRDLLEQVAVASGLAAAGGASSADGGAKTALARVVRKLDVDLDVMSVRKTPLIRVTYSSSDPVQAARVLDDLGRLYLEKHLAMHRPAGAYDFFSGQTERFRVELEAAEAKLQAYGRQQRVVSADVEREAALRQLADFEASLEHAHAEAADANRRIQELKATAVNTPSRMTTQVRTSDNPQLVAELKAKVLELELQRSQMVQKFKPSYAPLVQLEGQLAQARAALDATVKAPATEQTTDANPTYQWVENELARVGAERQAALARASAIERSISLYRDKARELDEKSAVQQELRRTMTSAEENYLLYRKKQEEARISDALDRTRIANVAIAEPPSVPALPSSSGRLMILLLGTIAPAALGLTTAYVLHYLNPYFHTPDDVEETLNIPVLATLPVTR